MYLVGTFTREYFDFTDNKSPMSLVGLVEKITKQHLLNANQNDDYQIINLITREYFDPKGNKWIKIKAF